MHVDVAFLFLDEVDVVEVDPVVSESNYHDSSWGLETNRTARSQVDE